MPELAIGHQPYRRTNPFDREIEKGKPLLEITLDVRSLTPQLVSGDPALTRLLQLAGFSFLRVIALPTDNPEITQVLERHGVLVAKLDNRTGMLVVGEETEKMSWGMMLDESDIVLTRGPASGSDRLPKSFWRHSPTEALELVRLVLLSKGVFKAAPDFRVGETLYYTFRQLKLFPGFQEPWSIAAHCRDENGFPDGLYEQLQSLSYRQEFLCRSSDQCRIYASRKAGHQNGTLALYHFAYFVMLATGLFDDLAWLAKRFYRLNLGRPDIDLRKSKLRKELERLNPSLKRYLEEDRTRNLLKLFYPIRDRLQHRLFLTTMQVIASKSKRQVLELPTETLTLIDEQPGKDPRAEWGVVELGDACYIEPERFVRAALDEITALHDTYLSKIPWADLLDSVAEEKRREVKKSQALFKTGVWKYLKWHREPLYF